MTAPHLDPTRRHDVVLLVDVTDGNPNGDPDADNEPRRDPLDDHGLITDVALKRRIRDTIAARHPDDPGMGIWINRGARLNDAVEAARDRVAKDAKKADGVEQARRLMCESHWDVRVFGGVMSTGKGAYTGGAGRATGPYQLTFGRSHGPIDPQRHTIGRVASTDNDDGQTLGAKWTVPYALYRAHGFWSPGNAARTGATAADLAALWEAQEWMFNDDRSAARGMMAMRAIIVMTHDNAHGRAHAHDLFDLITLTGDGPGIGNHRLGLPAPAERGVAVDVPGHPGVVMTVTYLSPALPVDHASGPVAA